MRIYLHGNCQTTVIRKMLEEADANLHVTNREVHAIDIAREMDDYVADIRGADIILAQPVNDTYRHEPRLSTRWIAENKAPGAELLTFPSVFFQGYTPSITYLRPHDAYGMPYHDAHVVELYCAGMAAAAILDRIEDGAFFDPAFMIAEFDRSLRELREREARGIDIPTSDIIAEHHADQALFFTVNHPARIFFHHLIARIADRLGLDVRPATAGREYLSGIMVPPYASAIRALGLRFANPFEAKAGWDTYRGARGFLCRRDYVTGLVAHYDAAVSRETLRDALAANRDAAAYLARYQAAHAA